MNIRNEIIDNDIKKIVYMKNRILRVKREYQKHNPDNQKKIFKKK